MSAAAKAVLEQAMQLSEGEREELASDLLASLGPPLPPTTREKIDRRIAEGLAQIERGEVIGEEELFAELESM